MTSLPPELTRPYQGYVYSYPHKTAYRTIAPPRPLRDVWRDEPRDRRFLYVHVPFCEMRCGFCNLFTVANPRGDIEQDYLDALEREAAALAEAAGPEAPAQVALGGGTPTYLLPGQLDRLFQILATHFADTGGPVAVETSPKTATEDRLGVLRDHGVQRISIGIQSFVEDETRAMGRPQQPRDVMEALDRIRATGFPSLNVDLIYGAEGQTPESWSRSIARALEWHPEEVYLYPLYVRPKTGLDGWREVWDQHRLELYRRGRDDLSAAGYDQISMRHFRRRDAVRIGVDEYSCQEDGMIGLGPGARSYTRSFHYSTDFAVSRASVMAVLAAYVQKTKAAFGQASNGIELTVADQQLRYLLKSLLRTEGLDRTRFRSLYAADPLEVFPTLKTLENSGLITCDATRITPTAAGLERSDAIGPWLYAPDVAERMRTFETS